MAGRDRVAAITGGVMLALVWTVYAHFLGPNGLPDMPLRIFENMTPPATVEFLDYRQLWLISFPILAAVATIILLMEARRKANESILRPAAGVAVLSALVLLIGSTSAEQTAGQRGSTANLQAEGPVLVETGEFYSDQFQTGSGSLNLEAEDMGGRVTPLPPHDKLKIKATIQAGGNTIELAADRPLVNHPQGAHTTWWGVGLSVNHHGKSGIGTDKLPEIKSKVAVFGLGNISLNGNLIATGVPVHVMTAETGFPENSTLELDAGMEGQSIPGLPSGHLRALWQNHTAVVDDTPQTARYVGGSLVLVGLLAGSLTLIKREPT